MDWHVYPLDTRLLPVSVFTEGCGKATIGTTLVTPRQRRPDVPAPMYTSARRREDERGVGRDAFE